MDGLLKFLNYKQRQWQMRIISVGINWNILRIISSFLIDRKRRRMDHEDANALIKLVRFCPNCHSTAPVKIVKQNEKNLSQPKGFIDSTQANDLLSCYR